MIVVKPGEKIPLDGIVKEGTSMIDTKALTGEPIPKKVNVGEEILSGCINLEGVLKIEITKEYENSTVSKILELVENASSKKSKSERFITKFAKYYTPKEFEPLQKLAEKIGIKHYQINPLVRSSYRAAEIFE